MLSIYELAQNCTLHHNAHNHKPMFGWSHYICARRDIRCVCSVNIAVVVHWQGTRRKGRNEWGFVSVMRTPCGRFSSLRRDDDYIPSAVCMVSHSPRTHLYSNGFNALCVRCHLAWPPTSTLLHIDAAWSRADVMLLRRMVPNKVRIEKII